MKQICNKCGYQWNQRSNNPTTCPNPKCRCRNWSNYEKKEIKVKIKETMLFSSIPIGSLLIAMSTISTYGKQYAYYLDKTPQQISTNLRQLAKMKLISSEWLNRKQIWTLDKEKFNEMCKKYVIKEIEKERTIELTKLDDLRDFERINAYIIKNKTLEWIKGDDVVKYRRTSKEVINKLIDKKIIYADSLFSESRFTNFMYYYIYLIYPNIQIPFREVIAYYVKWGSEL
jgi:hypothetical protein